MKVDLPKSDVAVTHVPQTSSAPHGIVITASRDGKERTWSGQADTLQGAVKGAVEKMFHDPISGEFVG